MNDNLLGYLLNALEPDEHRQVEEYLRTHPDAATKLERLRQTLAPLSADAEPPVPPPSLAISTFALIAEVQCRPPLPPAPPAPKPKKRAPTDWHWVRRPDLVLAASLLIMVAGLITTWVVHAHEQEQRTTCGQNMYRWWQALERYSDSHAKRFPAADPEVEPKGSHSIAGIFVPLLNDAHLVTADMSVGCPAQGIQAPPTYSTRELELMYRSDPNNYQMIAPSLARDYAYTLGYRNEAGKVEGLRRDDDGRLPLLADRPPLTAFGDSPNHGGHGQNVLYIGGNVRWCTTRMVGVDLDDIYLSQNKQIEAGLNRFDSVLAPSEANPYSRHCSW